MLHQTLQSSQTLGQFFERLYILRDINNYLIQPYSRDHISGLSRPLTAFTMEYAMWRNRGLANCILGWKVC